MSSGSHKAGTQSWVHVALKCMGCPHHLTQPALVCLYVSGLGEMVVVLERASLT